MPEFLTYNKFIACDHASIINYYRHLVSYVLIWIPIYFIIRPLLMLRFLIWDQKSASYAIRKGLF